MGVREELSQGEGKPATRLTCNAARLHGSPLPQLKHQVNGKRCFLAVGLWERLSTISSCGFFFTLPANSVRYNEDNEDAQRTGSEGEMLSHRKGFNTFWHLSTWLGRGFTVMFEFFLDQINTNGVSLLQYKPPVCGSLSSCYLTSSTPYLFNLPKTSVAKETESLISKWMYCATVKHRFMVYVICLKWSVALTLLHTHRIQVKINWFRFSHDLNSCYISVSHFLSSLPARNCIQGQLLQ